MRRPDSSSEALSIHREGRRETRKKEKKKQNKKQETRKRRRKIKLAKKPKLKPNQTESSWAGGLVLIEDVYNIYGL